MTRSRSLANRCVAFLRTRALLRPGMHYVIAVSGGVDSMTLLHLFAALAPAWKLKITASYIDHGLRPEALAEAAFVEREAERLHAGYVFRRVDVESTARDTGVSIQDAARTLRYAALETIRAEAGADLILTAHHADDQAETILMHVLKGSGVQGLVGIRPVHGVVARPLLEVPRADIESYAATHGVSWRHDQSNDTDDYLRNIIRHHVVPPIRNLVNPGFHATMARTGELFAGLDAWLSSWCAETFPRVSTRSEDGVSLAVQGLKEYFAFQQWTLIREAIALCGYSPAKYREVESVQRLIFQKPGARVLLRQGIVAFRDRDSLVIARSRSGKPEMTTVIPGETFRIGGTEFSSRVVSACELRFDSDATCEYLDFDSLRGPLLLRPWQPGDWMIPLGSHHKKNVSDVLTDVKIPSHRRHNSFVLECGGAITWVCGVRMDDRFKITERSRQALLVCWREDSAIP